MSINNTTNTFNIPFYNRNFKKLCPSLFAHRSITALDIKNIYDTLCLIDKNTKQYNLQYTHPTLEKLIDFISSQLESIYTEVEYDIKRDEDSCNVWDKINENFKLHGNPFDYEEYLTKLETEDYITLVSYYNFSNIYNKDFHYCEDLPPIHNKKHNIDKLKIFDKKARNSYLRSTRNMIKLDPSILSEKQILRHSKMPCQKKIIRKIVEKSQKNNRTRYYEED